MLRVVAAAVSHPVAYRLAARSGPQHLSFNCGRQQYRSISTSAAYSSAACTHPDASQVEDSKPPLQASALVPRSALHRHPKLAVKRQKQRVVLEAWQDLPFDTFMRALAPKNFRGHYPEAQNTHEALAGAFELDDLRLAPAPLSSKQFVAVLDKYLNNRNLDVKTFLAYRNAMLAKSWPDARRHMVDIADDMWPPFVLHRTINTISTPSEVSDALALLTCSISRARNLLVNGQTTAFKALQYCFVVLLRLTVKQYGTALHLIPRLTDLLLALFQRFPDRMARSVDLVNDFTRRCTGLPDQRARQAIMRLLDWLVAQQGTETLEDMRRRVFTRCISSIEASMKRSHERSSSSAHFVNIELMERLLQYDTGADMELKARALRCAIFASGIDRNYARTWQWFNDYEQCRRKSGSTVSGADYQLLAKALVRSKEGRQDAWKEFLRGEQLLRTQLEQTASGRTKKKRRRRIDNELAPNCIDLLEVMTKSDDVRLGKIFSMLGIFLQGGDDFSDGRSFVKGDRFSQAMLQRRADPYAYSVVMHGLLLRKRPKCAVTVWNAMLHRGVMPNPATLSLLLQNLFQLRDVKTALQQLQLWCERGVPKMAHACNKLKDIEVPSLSTTQVADIDAILEASASTQQDHETERYRVVPDPILATVVFSGLHSSGSQGIGSLWEVYQRTIRRFPDAPVLAMLLKASCPDDASSTIDAQRGRQVFRSMLFRKHPELAEHHNTLKEQLGAQGAAGWLFSEELLGARVEKWLTSVFLSRTVAACDDGGATQEANLDALVFTPELFEHYLRLLLHLEHSSENKTKARTAREEIIDVLSWMRHLHITPTSTHLALTVLDIEENLPPAVAARQLDVLDRWMADWLGEQASPSHEVMQRHWFWKTRRNGQGRGWFENVSGSQTAWSEQRVASKRALE